MATPTIIFEDGQEMVFSGSERMTIGRADDNNVIVDDEDMSPEHAEIVLHPDGAAEVRDRGSRTGTFVNDQRVESQLLRDGDHLSIGPLHAVFRLKRSAPSTGTTRIPLSADSHAQREMQNALEALKARHEEKTAGLARLEAEATAAKAKLEGLQSETGVQEKKLAALKKQSSEASKQLQKHSAQAGETRAALDAANKEILEARKRLETLTAEETAARQLIERAARQAGEDEQRAIAARRSADEETTRLEAIRRQIEEAEAASRTQQEERAASLRSSAKSLEEAQTRLDALRRQQEETAVQVEDARRERDGLRAESTALAEQSRAAQESLAAVRQDFEKVEQARRDGQTALEALNQQHEQKTAELRDILKRLAELHDQEAAAEKCLGELERRCVQQEEELAARLASLEAALAGKTAQMAEVESALRSAEVRQEDHHKLEAALLDLKRQISEAEAAAADVRERLDKERGLLELTLARREAAEADLEELHEQAAEHARHASSSIQPKTPRTTISLRLFLLLVPFAVLALAWWASEQSSKMRAMRGKGVVAMLADPKPALHPYAPRTEAERQIIDLVHEPLMRVGRDGTLQPALAELWRWSQDVTCWFADEKTARQAQELLQAQIGESNRWAEWHLSTVRVMANSLVLNFDDATHANTARALEVIAALRPQPVAFWRVESSRPIRGLVQRFLADAPLAKQIRRVWFDRDEALEIVTIGPAQRLLDELRGHLAAKVPAEVRAGRMGEVSALSEPVLDLDLRQGQAWHDGTPVTARDVKVTIEEVNRRPWLLPNREALRHIQEMEIQNGGNRLRVIFRSRYGPALCGWAGLPVLPAAWWKAHEQEDDQAFTLSPPPGAGAFSLAHLDARTLSLTPVGPQPEPPRFLFHFEASPLMTEVGLATKTTHLVWPATIAGGHDDLVTCLTPPNRRLVVLWNTQKPVLAEVRTREALAMSADVASIIAALPGRHVLSDASLFPPGMWLHTKAPRVAWNAQGAKRLLADAGWLPGVDGIGRNAGRKLEFSLLLVAGDPVLAATARLLAAQWRELGAGIRVETLASPDLLSGRLASREFDAVMLEQRFEVSWDQFPWWHSSQAKPGGTNFAGIEDPQTDLLLEALASEFEPAAAAERVRQLEGRLLSLQPMLPLFHLVEHAAVSARLAVNKPRASWTLRDLAFKPRAAARTAPALQLKLRDE